MPPQRRIAAPFWDVCLALLRGFLLEKNKETVADGDGNGGPGPPIVAASRPVRRHERVANHAPVLQCRLVHGMFQRAAWVTVTAEEAAGVIVTCLQPAYYLHTCRARRIREIT